MIKKRFNKKALSILLSLMCLISLVAIGCGKQSSSSSASSASGGDELKPDKDGLIPIKTWSRTNCASTPWVVADQKGFLKKYGLKVQYTGETQAAQQIPSILNGNNYVGEFHPNTYAVAVAGGANIIGIGVNGIDPTPDVDPKYRHMWWFIGPKAQQAGIKTFKDLLNYKKGQKLKFTTGAANICTDFEGNTIADKVGLPRDRIEWVTMPDSQAIQSLTQGLVDVAAVHPPYYKGMEQAGNVKIADTADTDLGPTAGLTYFVADKDWAKKNPNVAKKFVHAMFEAQTWADDHPEEAADLTAKHIGQPVSGSHYYSKTLKIDDAKYLQPWIDELVKNGSIPKGKVKASDLVTNAYQ
ncbi:ABC transporter substrate-binding protein [Clostridium arbusti]|uniref:ABC transporter substrate-binding protein n=1 Tax=Clostridium arbusti TaxID=1137848 RepID=UPI000287BBA9|nr:ABC transporter substrate-binding protein [Clostridium arbusti]